MDDIYFHTERNTTPTHSLLRKRRLFGRLLIRSGNARLGPVKEAMLDLSKLVSLRDLLGKRWQDFAKLEICKAPFPTDLGPPPSVVSPDDGSYPEPPPDWRPTSDFVAHHKLWSEVPLKERPNALKEKSDNIQTQRPLERTRAGTKRKVGSLDLTRENEHPRQR